MPPHNSSQGMTHAGVVAEVLPDVSTRWDTENLDLAAYLERTGYYGSLAPTLDTLRALVHAHLETIPFEGINPFLGEPVPLVEGALTSTGRWEYRTDRSDLGMWVLR